MENVNQEPSNAPTELSETSPNKDKILSPSEIILQIKSEREKNEKALEEMRNMLAQQQDLYARFALGGKSQAGQEPPKEKTIDEITQEDANKIIRKYFPR